MGFGWKSWDFCWKSQCWSKKDSKLFLFAPLFFCKNKLQRLKCILETQQKWFQQKWCIPIACSCNSISTYIYHKNSTIHVGIHIQYMHCMGESPAPPPAASAGFVAGGELCLEKTHPNIPMLILPNLGGIWCSFSLEQKELEQKTTWRWFYVFVDICWLLNSWFFYYYIGVFLWW